MMLPRRCKEQSIVGVQKVGGCGAKGQKKPIGHSVTLGKGKGIAPVKHVASVLNNWRFTFVFVVSGYVDMN
jgi:hypothetical protein